MMQSAAAEALEVLGLNSPLMIGKEQEQEKEQKLGAKQETGLARRERQPRLDVQILRLKE